MKKNKDDFDRNCRLGVKSEGYNEFIFSVIKSLSNDGFERDGRRMTFREAERLVYRVLNNLLDSVDKYKRVAVSGSLHLTRYGNDDNHYYSLRDKRKDRD